DQRRPIDRQVLHAGCLDPEVLAIQGAQQRIDRRLGELRIEAELIHLEVAGKAAPQKGERRRDPLVPDVGLAASGLLPGGLAWGRLSVRDLPVRDRLVRDWLVRDRPGSIAGGRTGD